MQQSQKVLTQHSRGRLLLKDCFNSIFGVWMNIQAAGTGTRSRQKLLKKECEIHCFSHLCLQHPRHRFSETTNALRHLRQTSMYAEPFLGSLLSLTSILSMIWSVQICGIWNLRMKSFVTRVQFRILLEFQIQSRNFTRRHGRLSKSMFWTWLLTVELTLIKVNRWIFTWLMQTLQRSVQCTSTDGKQDSRQVCIICEQRLLLMQFNSQLKVR